MTAVFQAIRSSMLTIIVGVVLAAVASVGLYQTVFGVASSFSQTISDGSQSVDIVDAGGTTVGSPSVTFSSATFSTSSQTVTGTLGTSSERIRVYNPTSDATWTIAIAATGGSTATWNDGSHTYDFNDSNTDGTDDADTDTKGGRLTVNPAAGTRAGSPDNTACPITDLTLGSSSSFREVASAVSSITLLTGGSSATTYCTWDLTGVGLSQVLPPSQPSGAYTLSFTITLS